MMQGLDVLPSRGRLLLRGMLLGAAAGASLGAVTFLVLGVAATASARRGGVAVPGAELLAMTVLVAGALGACAGVGVGLVVAITVGSAAARGAVPAVRRRATLTAMIATALTLIGLSGWFGIDRGGRVVLTTLLTIAAGPLAWLLSPWLVRSTRDTN